MDEPPPFNTHLRNVLLDLTQHPYPKLPSPPNLKKRASVALILRVSPSYHHPPSSRTAQPSSADLNAFFAQDWVQQGTAEVLFIKRANRKGDRWTGHVALPGGGRDEEDEDDLHTAIRETWEEVGIDLKEEGVLQTGNVPQRLVTSNWGSIPLMVLCPYIFLLTTPNPPVLRLQPTEIASAHWVPLQYLLSPAARTFEYQDVSARLAKQEWGLKRLFYRSLLGRMLFSAVKLSPSLSQIAEAASLVSREDTGTTDSWSDMANKALRWTGAYAVPVNSQPELHLWGLTLGVLADFLELLPPHNALQLWPYPTFSTVDVRLILWVMSWRFRRGKYAWARRAEKTASADDKARRLSKDERDADELENKPAEIEVGMDSVPLPRGRRGSLMRTTSVSSEHDFGKQVGELHWHGAHPPGAGESGLGVTKEFEGDGQAKRRARRGSTSSRIGVMLEGYYEILGLAIRTALVGRTVAGFALILYLWRRYRRTA